MVHRTREYFSLDSGYIVLVIRPGDSCVEIELATIEGVVVVIGERKLEITDRLVRHLLDRLGHHLRANQIVCFFVFACED